VEPRGLDWPRSGMATGHPKVGTRSRGKSRSFKNPSQLVESDSTTGARRGPEAGSGVQELELSTAIR
jgi:hypothetical protein